MKNIFISEMHEKDVENFTSDFGLFLRRVSDKPFKHMCNLFTNANIIYQNYGKGLSDEEYFKSLNNIYEPLNNKNISPDKNNIIVERYPELDDEPYIFVCNHTTPEDIENVLNIIDRNAYLVLGSIESLKYNPEMYLTWLNGMIPFDILDDNQRKIVLDKMIRVLKTNSILIFPEGSHNYSPNNLVNKLFTGPVNLSLKTGRKIVIITMIKDFENNISYIDVGNPIDLNNINLFEELKKQSEKDYVEELTAYIRDKMATAVYYLISRHFKQLKKDDYKNIEEHLRMKKIKYAFEKLKWNHDVFDAEYLIRKTKEDREYEDILESMVNLTLNPNAYIGGNKYWILKLIDYLNKDTVYRMREYWQESNKVLRKVK